MIGSLQIVLKNNKSRYVTGDRVSGYVLIDTDTSIESCTTITIAFSGKACTRYQARGGSKPQINTTPLFHRSKVLYTFPFRADPGQYKWHFEFVFPSICDRQAPKNEDGDTEDEVLPQGYAWKPLPPSLAESDGYGTGCKASVDYELEASFQYPDWATASSPGMTANLSVVYVPSHHGPEPYYQYWLEEQKYLASDSFAHPFEARITFPTVYVHGQWLLIYLSVVDRRPDQLPIYLTDIAVTVITKCEVWVDGERHAFSTETVALLASRMSVQISKSNLTHRLTQDPWGIAFKGDGLPPKEGLPISGKKAGGLKVPSIVCPDVRIPNIAISHRLRIKATLCAGERQVRFEKSGDLEILAPMAREHNNLSSIAPPRPPPSPDITPSFAAQENELPPPYSESI